MRTKQVEEYLPVKLTEAELLEHGADAAEIADKLRQLESEHKAVKEAQKAEVSGLNESLQQHLRLVRAKQEYRDVLCEWALDQPAKGRKSLIRTDTLETVRVADMTGEDFQRELDVVMEVQPME